MTDTLILSILLFITVIVLYGTVGILIKGEIDNANLKNENNRLKEELKTFRVKEEKSLSYVHENNDDILDSLKYSYMGRIKKDKVKTKKYQCDFCNYESNHEKDIFKSNGFNLCAVCHWQVTKES